MEGGAVSELIEPPRDIPSELVGAFTMGGVIPVEKRYRDDSGTRPTVYSLEDWLDALERARVREPWYYPKTDVALWGAFEAFPVKGKKVAVFGSARPWYEAIFWDQDVGEVVVFEYADVEAEFEDEVEYRKPGDFEVGEFDAAVSISTFEHAGLGRYGDPVDADGDLKAMQAARACLRTGGVLFLSVPVGMDRVVWNLHRVYGRKRLACLLEGWMMVGRYHWWDERIDMVDDQYQPLLVLER